MKKILLVLMLLCMYSLNVNAQIEIADLQKFEFKNGISEWSEPILVNLLANKSDKTIPVSIRVKYNKKT